jgi:hypothetical protein
MTQGNKQKYVFADGRQASILDLDKGTRLMLIQPRKVYLEMPFPPHGMMSSNVPSVTFKKTGSVEKIAGYSCDDYLGTGTLPGGSIKVETCVSTTAPGAAGFTQFQKTMAEKVKGTPMAMMAATPPGIPLKLNTTLTPTGPSERPPVTAKITVTKVTKQSMPMMMGHMPPPGMPGHAAPGAAAPSPGAAPSKVPE